MADLESVQYAVHSYVAAVGVAAGTLTGSVHETPFVHAYGAAVGAAPTVGGVPVEATYYNPDNGHVRGGVANTAPAASVNSFIVTQWHPQGVYVAGSAHAVVVSVKTADLTL